MVEHMVLHHLRTDILTCRLNDSITAIKTAEADDRQLRVVLDEQRIVLGLLDLSTIDNEKATAAEYMKPAPQTLRPSVTLEEASQFLAQAKRPFALVTKSTGEFMGIFQK